MALEEHCHFVKAGDNVFERCVIKTPDGNSFDPVVSKWKTASLYTLRLSAAPEISALLSMVSEKSNARL